MLSCTRNRTSLSASRISSACFKVLGSLTIYRCVRPSNLLEGHRANPTAHGGACALVSLDPSFETLNLTCKQDRNMRHVHYVDSGTKFPVQPGNEGPPDKIGEIAQSTCGLLSNVPLLLAHDALAPSPTSLSSASPPGFSLLSVCGGESPGDHVATDVSGWAD